MVYIYKKVAFVDANTVLFYSTGTQNSSLAPNPKACLQIKQAVPISGTPPLFQTTRPPIALPPRPMWSQKPSYGPLAAHDEDDLPLALSKNGRYHSRSTNANNSLFATFAAYARRRGPRTTLLLLLAGLSCIAFSKLSVESPLARYKLAGSSLTHGFPIPSDSNFLTDGVRNNWTPFNVSDAQPLLPDPLPHTADLTTPERLLSDACAERFIADGVVCDLTFSNRRQLSYESRISIIYAYENGSDPILSSIRDAFIGSEEVQGHAKDARHFRVHNELQYSLRSVVRAFKNRLATSLASFHLLTTDLPDLPFFDSDNPALLLQQGRRQAQQTPWRWGFKPSWLKANHMHHKHMTISPEYPWRFFQTHNVSLSEAQAWREEALPSFQSMSIESSIPHIHTQTDIAMGLCDDFFFMKELAPSDSTGSL